MVWDIFFACSTIFPKTFSPLSRKAHFANYFQLLYSKLRKFMNTVVDQKLLTILFLEKNCLACVTLVTGKIPVAPKITILDGQTCNDAKQKRFNNFWRHFFYPRGSKLLLTMLTFAIYKIEDNLLTLRLYIYIWETILCQVAILNLVWEAILFTLKQTVGPKLLKNYKKTVTKCPNSIWDSTVCF